MFSTTQYWNSLIGLNETESQHAYADRVLREAYCSGVGSRACAMQFVSLVYDLDPEYLAMLAHGTLFRGGDDPYVGCAIEDLVTSFIDRIHSACG